MKSEQAVGTRVLQVSGLRQGDTITLKSFKGDFLLRHPDGTVTALHTPQMEWTMEKQENGTVMLRSSKGDYLHRPETQSPGVTTCNTGVGNEWIKTPVHLKDGTVKYTLRSWLGDYLHRADTPSGVTTVRNCDAPGNLWQIEELPAGKIRLLSWKDDYLSRPDTASPGVTTFNAKWTVELLEIAKIRLRSWAGDYLHRSDSDSDSDSDRRVTLYRNCDGPGNNWTVALNGDEITLESWKKDYLHRKSPDDPPVTAFSSNTAPGSIWTIVKD